MKIERKKAEFEPITITIETLEEAISIRSALAAYPADEGVQDALYKYLSDAIRSAEA